MTTLNIKGLTPDDDRNVTAINFIATAWDELSDEFKAQALVQLYGMLNQEQRNEFAEGAEVLDNKLATARFVELIEKHKGDTEYIDFANDAYYLGDELIPFANAFHELCMERGAYWTESHDWKFVEKGSPIYPNAYDVVIY